MEILPLIGQEPITTELREMAVTIVTAAQLTGKTDKQIAQDVFLGLPTEHYLLHDYPSRKYLDVLIRDERKKITEARNA